MKRKLYITKEMEKLYFRNIDKNSKAYKDAMKKAQKKIAYSNLMREERENAKATSVQGIYDEMMVISKGFRESTPRTRETRVKRIYTLRMKKLRRIA